MNLAQLIDPEWVQQGTPDRFPVRRPAIPAAELQVVMRKDGISRVVAAEQATGRNSPNAEGPAEKPERLFVRARTWSPSR